MRKLFLIFAGCILITDWGGNAMMGNTNLESLWKQVDKAREDGLPRTAITHLNEIYDLAVAEKLYPQALKALSERVVMESVVEGNLPEEKIAELRDTLPYPPEGGVKPA